MVSSWSILHEIQMTADERDTRLWTTAVWDIWTLYALSRQKFRRLRIRVTTTSGDPTTTSFDVILSLL